MKASIGPDLPIAGNFLFSSPDHKLPSRSRQESEGDEDIEDAVESSEHTNLFGVNFIIWLKIGIEGKCPMDQEEEDWGGKLEFGFSDSNFLRILRTIFFYLRTGALCQSIVLEGLWEFYPISGRK